MNKKFCLIFLLLLLFPLVACADVESNNVELDDTTTDTTDNADIGLSPYLSITARRQSPVSEKDWDEVYYIYDLAKGELQEICVLPHLSGYTTGIVSLEDEAVYFSQRESENSNDQICKYDIKSGELTALEDDNHSYNDLALIDQNTLLVIASTNQHTITPALFDLRSREFTYMADVNHEQFDLYTTGGLLLNYNYLFDKFPWLTFKLANRYSDAYHNLEEALDHEFIMASKDLCKSDNYRFTAPFMLRSEVIFLSQISENDVLVGMGETIIDLYGTNDRVEYTYHLLAFDGENTSFVQIENPFPMASYVSQCLTFDGGKTYYCLGGFVDESGLKSGLFIYNCETDARTPVLLADDKIRSVANFRSVGY